MRRKKVVRKRRRLRSVRVINIRQLAKFLGMGGQGDGKKLVPQKT